MPEVIVLNLWNVYVCARRGYETAKAGRRVLWFHKCYPDQEQSKHLCSFIKANPDDVTEPNITRPDQREIIAIAFKPIWYLVSHFQLSLMIPGLPNMMKSS